MTRPAVREIPVTSVGMRRGEVLVPTELGDRLHGRLHCLAAPLVAGLLRAKGRPVRVTDLAGDDDAPADADGRLFVATCPQQDGSTAAIAAAAAPGEALSAAAARAAVEDWAAVSGSRSLLLAASPWCAGALHAASAARAAAAGHQGTGRRVHVLAPVAMPPETASALAELGAVVTESLAAVEPGDVVVFPAHGVTEQTRADASQRGATVVDATCPLVAAAQTAAARAAEHGHQLVLIGQPGHAATGPITSKAPRHVTAVENPAHAAAVRVTDGGQVSYLTLPGIALEAGAPIVSALRSRYPAVRPTVPSELCYAPSDRAGTVYSVALGSDVMLVAGDPQSADARQLCGQARDAGTRVHVIADAADIRPQMLASVHTIGLAESTSAPAGLAAQVLAALSGLGRLTVARRRLSTENATSVLA